MKEKQNKQTPEDDAVEPAQEEQVLLQSGEDGEATVGLGTKRKSKQFSKEQKHPHRHDNSLWMAS